MNPNPFQALSLRRTVLPEWTPVKVAVKTPYGFRPMEVEGKILGLVCPNWEPEAAIPTIGSYTPGRLTVFSYEVERLGSYRSAHRMILVKMPTEYEYLTGKILW